MSVTRFLNTLIFLLLIALALFAISIPAVIRWLDAQNLSALALSDLTSAIGVCAVVAVTLMVAVIWYTQFLHTERLRAFLWALLAFFFVLGVGLFLFRVLVVEVSSCHESGALAEPAVTIENSFALVRCT